METTNERAKSAGPTLSKAPEPGRSEREPVTKDSPLYERFNAGLITPKEAIVELARTFPTLRNLVPKDPKKWDIGQFMQPLWAMGSGAHHAMRFVGSVWNPSDAKEQGWEFNVVEALGSWDCEHRRAFLIWAIRPWWA